jgi:hypothetical protein
MSRKKKELTNESSTKDKMLAMVSAGEYFDCDLTEIIGRDQDGTLLGVAVYAKGEDAEALLRWLKARDKKAGT